MCCYIIKKSTKRGSFMLEVIATCLEDVKRIEESGGNRDLVLLI